MANDMGRTVGVGIVGLGLLALVISAPAGDELGAQTPRENARDWEGASAAAETPPQRGNGGAPGDGAADAMKQEAGETIPQPGISADAAIERWPALPQKAAQKLLEKYGAPDEVTHGMLIWRDKGPFRRVVIFREQRAHEFPRPHSDIVYQEIDYSVPVDRFDDLARFDGSLLPDRTAGRLGVRGESEEMNLLSLNLAHEIVTGKRSVAGARAQFAKAAALIEAGKSSPYTESLLFRTGAAQPDLDAPKR